MHKMTDLDYFAETI